MKELLTQSKTDTKQIHCRVLAQGGGEGGDFKLAAFVPVGIELVHPHAWPTLLLLSTTLGHGGPCERVINRRESERERSYKNI
jgi:hypothetical protein